MDAAALAPARFSLAHRKTARLFGLAVHCLLTIGDRADGFEELPMPICIRSPVLVCRSYMCYENRLAVALVGCL